MSFERFSLARSQLGQVRYTAAGKEIPSRELTYIISPKNGILSRWCSFSRLVGYVLSFPGGYNSETCFPPFFVGFRDFLGHGLHFFKLCQILPSTKISTVLGKVFHRKKEEPSCSTTRRGFGSILGCLIFMSLGSEQMFKKEKNNLDSGNGWQHDATCTKQLENMWEKLAGSSLCNYLPPKADGKSIFPTCIPRNIRISKASSFFGGGNKDNGLLFGRGNIHWPLGCPFTSDAAEGWRTTARGFPLTWTHGTLHLVEASDVTNARSLQSGSTSARLADCLRIQRCSARTRASTKSVATHRCHRLRRQSPSTGVCPWFVWSCFEPRKCVFFKV